MTSPVCHTQPPTCVDCVRTSSSTCAYSSSTPVTATTTSTPLVSSPAATQRTGAVRSCVTDTHAVSQSEHTDYSASSRSGATLANENSSCGGSNAEFVSLSGSYERQAYVYVHDAQLQLQQSYRVDKHTTRARDDDDSDDGDHDTTHTALRAVCCAYDDSPSNVLHTNLCDVLDTRVLDTLHGGGNDDDDADDDDDSVVSNERVHAARTLERVYEQGGGGGGAVATARVYDTPSMTTRLVTTTTTMTTTAAAAAADTTDAHDDEHSNSNSTTASTTTMTAATMSAAGVGAYTSDEHTRSNLFICGLAPCVDDAALSELFGRYGAIESAKVMLDIHTGRSRCIAFVKYVDVQHAAAALQALNGATLHGQTLTVRIANSRAAYLPSAPTNKTFVRNVPITVTRARLLAYFATFGEVVDMSIHNDTVASRRAPRGQGRGDVVTSGGVCVPGSIAIGALGSIATTTTTSTAAATSMTAPPPSPAMHIVFVTYTNKESAARAAAATHTKMPFPECNGVPLLAKVAEDNVRRVERLMRRCRVSSRDTRGDTPPLPVTGMPTTSIPPGVVMTSMPPSTSSLMRPLALPPMTVMPDGRMYAAGHTGDALHNMGSHIAYHSGSVGASGSSVGLPGVAALHGVVPSTQLTQPYDQQQLLLLLQQQRQAQATTSTAAPATTIMSTAAMPLTYAAYPTTSYWPLAAPPTMPLSAPAFAPAMQPSFAPYVVGGVAPPPLMLWPSATQQQPPQQQQQPQQPQPQQPQHMQLAATAGGEHVPVMYTPPLAGAASTALATPPSEAYVPYYFVVRPS